MKYYTDNHISVDQRIEDKKTFISRSRLAAEEAAKKQKSYTYILYEMIEGVLRFWGYAVPKLLIMALMLTGLNSNAQFITTPEDDINTQFGFFIDPTLTDKGSQFGIFMTAVMHWGYVGVSASTYPNLGEVGYTDLVGELGLNGHLGGYEPIRSYAGFRLGHYWRGDSSFPLAGGVVGFDWRVTKINSEIDVYFGLKLWADYREGQKDKWFGSAEKYKRGLVTNNPLLQENGALVISFSF
jgi:hypothetical protein